MLLKKLTVKKHSQTKEVIWFKKKTNKLLKQKLEGRNKSLQNQSEQKFKMQKLGEK